MSAARMREAILEDPRAFVDQRVDRALDDFLAGEAAPGDAGRRGGGRDERLDLGVGDGLALVVVEEPPGAGLLAEVVHRHELIGDERLALRPDR